MTSTEKHTKHVDLARPQYGEFGRLEFGILGAPCGVIQGIAEGVIKSLSDKYHIAYVDADHASADNDTEADFAHLRYTDKITGRRLDMLVDPNRYERQKFFNPADLILVNGNHFHAQKQVVIIHPEKRKSLHRKLDRLSNIALVILADDETEVFDFLKEHLSKGVTVLSLKDRDSIANWFRTAIAESTPGIKGLVLAGGKSQRMGFDKTRIEYFDKPHSEYLADLLSKHCNEVYVSRREDQVDDMADRYSVIPDTFTGLGPFGGILSAFRTDPNSAWLVVASDLPLVSRETLHTLIAKRKVSSIATAFMNNTTGFPDPLITLWEPRAYPVMLEFLALGYSCPRKVLINSDVHIVEANQEWLTNVNTAEQLDSIKSKLS